MVDFVRITPGPVSPLAAPVMVPMRDGVRLATDVYLPGGDTSSGDTILIRLPYDKCGTYTYIPLIAEYFMESGYRVVAQDVRGKFRSEGEAVLWVHEVDDGYDSIEWIVDQPWSNGCVAMWGDSYYGFTQWAAVASEHPALTAISARVTGTQLGLPIDAPGGGGPQNVEWGVTYCYCLQHYLTNDSFEWEPDWTERPLSGQAETFMGAVGVRSISYDQHLPTPTFAPRFGDRHPFEAHPVPVLHTIGWWDNCAPHAWADVVELERRSDWSRCHHVRLEAMDHESNYVGDPPRAAVPTREQLTAALPRMLEPTLDFFEIFVRGNGAADAVPKVTWNLAGTPECFTATSWPPDGTRPESLHATAMGTLTSSRDDDGTDLEWVHDPDDPVPSSVRDAFSYLGGLVDEAPIGDRDDVLVFDAAPVTENVDLVGPVSADVVVASDGPVMDVFVRLLDVAPDGRAIRIARGQQQIVGPFQPTCVTIELGQLGYRLEAGHRLRLHVHSSDVPEFLLQPGTGEHPWYADATCPNRQRLRVGGPDGLTLHYSVLPGPR
jgi:predicted acyl esterase